MLRSLPRVREAVVLARRDGPGDRRLVAYVVPQPSMPEPIQWTAGLRAALREKLPDYMVPSAFVLLDALPLTAQRQVGPPGAAPPGGGTRGGGRPRRPAPDGGGAGDRRDLAGDPRACRRWAINDNFFDLGGHSLLLIGVQRRLREVLGRDLPLIDFFRYPSVGALAGHLGAGREPPADPGGALRPASAAADRSLTAGSEIAVVGMAGRFPQAPSVTELWTKLCAGTELISFFSEEEGLASGLALDVLRDPRYVNARGALAGSELFDAAFFNYSPREAQIMDPQQRIFLELLGRRSRTPAATPRPSQAASASSPAPARTFTSSTSTPPPS